MSKYSKKIVDVIVELMEEGNFSISDICHKVGISRKSFYQWKDTKPEFTKALQEANNRRFESLRERAVSLLEQKLDIQKHVVKRTVYIPSTEDKNSLEIKQQTVTEKYIFPEDRLLLQLADLISSTPAIQTKELDQKPTPPLVVFAANKKENDSLT